MKEWLDILAVGLTLGFIGVGMMFNSLLLISAGLWACWFLKDGSII